MSGDTDVSTDGDASVDTDGSADADGPSEYESIVVPAGEVRVHRVGDDEVFENKLIDITASGAVFRIIIEGRDATVRNIGWTGTQDAESYAVLAHEGSGDALIENVYMGDGSSTGHSAGSRDPTAMWLSPNASGTLTVRGANVQGWGDNGMYFSNPSATTTIENSYLTDNNNAEYRLPGGGTVRNSVVRNGQDRGVWAWGPGTVTVDNCDIHMASGGDAFWAGEASHTNATIDVSNTQWSGDVAEPHGTVNFLSGTGNNPRDFLPVGCPATAVEAASGSPSGSGP